MGFAMVEVGEKEQLRCRTRPHTPPPPPRLTTKMELYSPSAHPLCRSGATCTTTADDEAARAQLVVGPVERFFFPSVADVRS